MTLLCIVCSEFTLPNNRCHNSVLFFSLRIAIYKTCYNFNQTKQSRNGSFEENSNGDEAEKYITDYAAEAATAKYVLT